MHRQHYHQSKLIQSNYNEEVPFFREAVTLIDECTKLMKQDRIILRNKLKEYFKQLKENRNSQNEWQNEQIQLLVQIFVETNKKKSLNKIQKGDKVMDWLQIKLRKYMDNNKKERHRKQVQQFRVNKNSLSQKSKENHVFGEKTKEVTREKSYRPNLSSNINKLSFNLGSKRTSGINNSLSKSRDKDISISSRKMSQNNVYSSSSFHQKFSHLKKPKIEENSSQYYKLSQKQKFNLLKDAKNDVLNKSQDNYEGKGNSIQKKYNNFMENPNKYSYKSYVSSENHPKFDNINKITELFSKQLNKNSNQNQEEIPKNKRSSEVVPYNQYIIDKKLKPFDQIFSMNEEKIKPESQTVQYQKSSKNIQQIFKNTQNLMQKCEYKEVHAFDSFMKNNMPNIKSNEKKDLPYRHQQNYESNSLFTPPDLLAECRKFLSNSNQKRQLQAEDSNRAYNDLINQQQKKTFSKTINEIKDKSYEKSKLNQLNIYEVTSENNSLNISCKKPNMDNNSQVLFKMKMISIYSIEELLMEIFKNNHKVSLDRFQLGEIMSRCQPQIQKYLQSYCDILQNQSNGSKFNIDFLAFIKYLYTYGKIFQSNNEYFSISLCEILDIQKKGYVDKYDIQGFLQSIQNSQLEPFSYDDIKNLLLNIYAISCGIQGSENIMTYWSLYFLQLKKDKELERLAQILNKFQFQYETQQ